MSVKQWNFWANRYDRLWVQKHSLGPTRKYVLEEISSFLGKDLGNITTSLLDLGCGTGELLWEMREQFPYIALTGIDFSSDMLKISQGRNSDVRHLLMDAMDIHGLDQTFDLITCTHSLPYYEDGGRVLQKLAGLLTDRGKLVIGFASGNSLFDRIILAGVKLTTGMATYPSDKAFRAMVKKDFKVEKVRVIKEAIYMPRIAVYTLSLKSAKGEKSE